MLLFDLIYTAFWVPLSVGFCIPNYGSSATDVCGQADLFGGSIYTFNLLMAFQWGAVIEYDNLEIESKDGVLLAEAYVRFGRFWIDLVTTIPFVLLIVDLATTGDDDNKVKSYIAIISLIRLIRLIRLVSISKIVYLNAAPSKSSGTGLGLSVATTYILLLGYMLVVAVNFMACIMLLCANLEGAENSWLISITWMDFVNATAPQQWYCAIYWVITTATATGYGDVVPKSIAEQVLANLVMIVGLVIFGLLVGTISQTTTRASASANKLHNFRKKITRVSEWLTEHDVPDKTKEEVKLYFTRIWAAREDLSLDADVLNELPHYLRQAIATHVMLSTISSMRIFKNQEEGFKELVAQSMRPVDVAPGSDLCQQGEEGDRIWIVLEGDLLALQHLARPIRLRAPCIIGDSIVLGDDIPAFRSRPFTIRTLDSTLVRAWELKVSALWPILRMYPSYRSDAISYVCNETLVHLAEGRFSPSPRQSDGGDYFSRPTVRLDPVQKAALATMTMWQQEPKEMDSRHAWCESAVSIGRALLHQTHDLVDLAMDELRKAKAEDGSLQILLDSLMDFSMTKAFKTKYAAGTETESKGTAPHEGPASKSSSGLRETLDKALSSASKHLSPDHVGDPTSGGTGRKFQKSLSSVSHGVQYRSPTSLASPRDGGGEVANPMSRRSLSLTPYERLHVTTTRASPFQVAALQDSSPLDSSTPPLSSHAQPQPQAPNPGGPSNLIQQIIALPSRSPSAHISDTSRKSTAGNIVPYTQGPGGGGGAGGPSGASGGNCGEVNGCCPTCLRLVCCPTCGFNLLGGNEMRISALGEGAGAGQANALTAALGLQPAKQQRWKPSRLGRQTLFRISSLVDRDGSIVGGNEFGLVAIE